MKKKRMVNTNQDMDKDYIIQEVIMETRMRECLAVWKDVEKKDYTEELEDSPWISDVAELMLEDIRESFMASVDAYEELDSSKLYYGDGDGLVYREKLEFFFRGPAVDTIIKQFDIVTDISVTDLKYYKSLYDKAYKFMCAEMEDTLELKGLVAGDLEMGMAFKNAEGYLETSVLKQDSLYEYFEEMVKTVQENPVTVNTYVNDNMDLFKNAIKKSSVDWDEFASNCEGVLNFDIVLIKADELYIDEGYMDKLRQRRDDPFSLHTNSPVIYKLTDKFDVESAKVFYELERHITDEDLLDIYEGRNTMEEICKILKEKANFEVVETTNLFGD